MTLTGRVSPFGNPRIDGCSPLPTAYRSVLRPSSPLSAKAFTRCPYALDLCLEFFTHRDKRPCRSSSKPHSYTQRFFMTANQFGTPTPGARLAIACETNITAFGRRPERPGSQSKRIPIDNDKQRARNDDKVSIGQRKFSSIRVRSGNRHASRRQRAIEFSHRNILAELKSWWS
jgi:hypothetical protein